MVAIDADKLGRHRIAEVRTRRIRTRWPRLLGRNARLEEHGYGSQLLVRELVTDGGATGWGVCRHLLPQQTPKLAGRRVNDLFDPAIGVIADEARPLDLALHDLAGAILGVPVYRMLGARGDTTVPVYGGAIYMDDITPAYHPGGVGVVIEHCRADWDLGYRDFKIKIGRGARWMDREAGLRRDIEVTRAVREHFPSGGILVDGNNGFTCDDFLRYFAAVADCALATVEEPFHENRDDLRRLRDMIEKLSPATTVTEGESKADIELLLALGAERLIDILNLDIDGYGFTNWRRLAPQAAERGLLLSPHTFDLQIKTFYAAHLVAGVGHGWLLEGVPDETEGVDTSRYRFADGLLRVPDAPGFGMPFIWGRTYNDQGIDDSGYRLVM